MTLALLVPTPPTWVRAALADLDATLCDHLHCERKAAASALSLLHQYPGRTELVRSLARLAHEESRHVMQVASRLRKRGVVLGRDHGDEYAQRLRKCVRRGEPERQLDLLLCSAIIEARSAERLALLATALEDALMARFYHDLANAEVGHRDLFLNLARPLVAPPVFAARLAEFLTAEAEIMIALPICARIH